MYTITVKDNKGNPIPSVVVTAIDSAGHTITTGGSPVASITDANGTCVIDDNVDHIASFVAENQAWVQSGYVVNDNNITITMEPLSGDQSVKSNAAPAASPAKAMSWLQQYWWIVLIAAIALIAAIWYFFFHSKK
jgi:hypothetical protein